MRRLFPVTDQTRTAAETEWTLDALADLYAYPVVDAGGSGGEGTGAGLGTGAGTGPGGDAGTGTGPGGSPDAGAQPGADASTRPCGDAAAPPRGGAGAGVWLRANMVSTLDGAAQHDGLSQALSSAADMRIFGTLRALADAVVVGAETVRQEGYRPARAREAFAARRAAAGQRPAPAIAVVTASLDLDFSLPLFTEPLVPTLVLTGAAAPADRVLAARKAGAEVLVAGDGAGVDPVRAVRALAGRGLRRLLAEGGPRLLGQFLAAGVLDELCLTLSPTLTSGYAQRITGGPALAVPERFALASLLEEDGFLFSRYRRA